MDLREELAVGAHSMKSVLYLLTVLALLGAFDTLYYHEWRARLPALGRSARSELRLHAFRDFVYTILLSVSRGWYGKGGSSYCWLRSSLSRSS